MKKSLIALTTALSFGLAAAQTAAPVSAPQVPALTDVPAGHWAKDAIDRLVSRGIILGYPDGTFRGTQNLTRYEAAIIIARLLDQMRDGETPAGMTAEDMTALQNAIQELAADLAALGVRVSDLEANAVSKDDFARLEARIEEVAAAGGEQGASEDIQGQIDELTARVDEYDALRADVDDNASSIAALNDLTVLLNQDILDLQDRVSAVEAAQADFVQRSDFDALGGRVTTVETRVETVNNTLSGRIAALERNAFSVKPSLTIGYKVSRANRNFDVDRLFPLNKDGTVAANAFTSGDVANTAASESRDFGDFGRDTSVVKGGEAGLYGFAVESTAPSYYEGETTISFGLDFANSGQFTQVTSASSGSLFSTAGKLDVNSINVDFGLTSSPDSTAKAGDKAWSDVYPSLTDADGYTYRPVFFKFKNATANFSVGGNPLKLTVGRGMKFYFADYAFDNNVTGRGDGYMVEVDGSNLPVLGAFKPKLTGVYGSRGGNDKVDEVGFGVYYRGLRADITPVGNLRLGVFYAQEGRDAFGAANTSGVAQDVTLYGADAHGTVAGVPVHSEYVTSRVNPVSSTDTATNSTADVYTTSAFYARIANRKDDKSFDLDKPAVKVGNDAFNFSVYDLNYRQIDSKYTAAAGLSEAGYPSASQVALSYGTSDGKVTAPFANLTGRVSGTSNAAANIGSIGQKGFGVKAAAAVGPIALGGYYDTSTGANGSFTSNDANLLTEYGGSAKAGVSIFSVRADYNYVLANRVSVADGAAREARRYAVQADVTPGLGFSIGAYYRNVEAATDRGTLAKATSSSLFNLGYLKSSFRAGSDNTYYTGLTCADYQGDLGSNDVDGVGNVLNPKASLSRSSSCFSGYGVEVAHNGGDANALVKGLDARVGYGAVYRPASGNYDGRITYANVGYSQKVGVADVRVAGGYNSTNLTSTESGGRYAGTRGTFGVMVNTAVLNDVVFKPQFNGQFGYYTSTFDADNNTATASLTANAMKYGVGVVLNDFLMPETKIGVRYDGYTATNREYVPYTGSTAGYFQDANTNGTRINLNGVYVEGAYRDMVFSYGNYTLSGKNGAGREVAAPNGQPARGQTFKISYKVNF
ncbi:S-layer homology domain-containing protein [Deinococcus wulumuqiensis]